MRRVMQLQGNLAGAVVLGVALAWSGATWGQPPDAGKSSADTSSLLQQLNDHFEKIAPKIGEPLPDVSAHDADGREWKLRSLKGHYSVVVFGCLT
jgi:hypothetical protein